jgi:hypothetical protein
VNVRADLAERGYVLLPGGAVAASAPADPWSLIERLTGERPLRVERQPIRKIEGGQSFASTSAFTPLHTDSQDFLGAPPGLQIMACRAPAARGGTTLLVDGWALTRRIEREDPSLYSELFTAARDIPFYFGNVVGPTVALKAGAVVITASPMPAREPVGRAFGRFLERAEIIEVAIAAGETLLVDNHRMLHGRTAFDGAERQFLRFLAWLPTPLRVNDHWLARAGASRTRANPADAQRRLYVVMELVSGVPPAKLAAREGITEAELYRWRSTAFAAARAALEP